MRYMHFLQPVSSSETIQHEGSPAPKIALIREITALLFWDSFNSPSIRLSGAEPKLKITANSTYWEANLRSNGLEHWLKKKNPCFDDVVFGGRSSQTIFRQISSSGLPYWRRAFTSDLRRRGYLSPGFASAISLSSTRKYHSSL